MLKRLILAIVAGISLLALGTVAGPAHAQSYRFAIPELKMDVTVLPDGWVNIVYDITFENFGSPIDIVDIGLPHRDYDIDTMSASVDGVDLSDIRTSEVIDIGVEVHLGGQAISAGETGTLHFEATMPDMVYQDTTDRDLASFRITPTWFDGDLVQGTSNIAVAIHLPEGIDPDEVLYQQEPFTTKALYQGHTVAVWQWPDAYATSARMVGVSFPSRVMTNIIRMTVIDLAKQWLEDHPQTAVLLGVACFGLLTALFFRFTGGTGCAVFGVVAVAAALLFITNPVTMLGALPLLVGLVIVNEVRRKRSASRYLPPVAQTEGGGIKRGLTAPEAAVLLELPFGKVLTLVIFGLLEKGILELVTQDPLKVSIRDDFVTWDNADDRRSPKKRRLRRRAAARKAGTIVHDYETHFLDDLERNPGKAVGQINFTKSMERLIKSATAKMARFDLSDTQDYYRRVIDRAMKQAEGLGEVEAREAYLDKHLPWVMMDKDYPTVLAHPGGPYWPMWMRPSRPTSSGSSTGRRSESSRPARGGKSSLGDVAGSFVGWAETTMGGMAAAVLPSSMSLPSARGFVDLSGVDRVTSDVFQAISKASRSSSGGGGGGSGGSSCACACAGCACACACAGGGR